MLSTFRKTWLGALFAALTLGAAAQSGLPGHAHK